MAVELFLRGVDQSMIESLGSTEQIKLIDNETAWILFYDEDHRLCLNHAEETKRKPLVIDFNSEASLAKARSIRKTSQPLLKALGKGKPETTKVWDATAGLAQDSFLMISAGYKLTMIEQNPVIFLLLQDAIERYEQANAPDVKYANSIDYMRDSSNSPDVIYLDPMFPEKKKGRLSQGPMQWMQKLLESQEPSPAAELLAASLNTAKERVVVKRGLKDPKLEGPLIHSYTGSSVRYDMYQSGKSSR